MRTLVVDASVALKWLVLEDMSDVAKELYGAGDHLVAPRLITTEIANALVRKTMQGTLNSLKRRSITSTRCRSFYPI